MSEFPIGMRLSNFEVVSPPVRRGCRVCFQLKCLACGHVRTTQSHWLRARRDCLECAGCQQRKAFGVTLKPDHYEYRIYRILAGMKSRCHDSNCVRFPAYGARGIGVCDRWRNSYHEFREWSLANGYAADLTIDRIDNDGDYCPENCRWVTTRENTLNRAATKWLEAFGETKPLTMWVEDPRCVVSIVTFKNRLRRDWPVEKAMTTPPDNRFLTRTKSARSGNAITKPKQPHCERHSTAKLTEQQVIEVIRRYQAGETQHGLACAYGISDLSIYKIVHGITWRHITRPFLAGQTSTIS